MTHKEHLFLEFEPVSTQKWIQTIEKALKGKEINSLNWEVEKDLSISPLCRADNTEVQQLIVGDSKNNNWSICEEFFVVDSTNCTNINQLILNALNGGANALILQFDFLPTVADWAVLLNNVLLDIVTIHIKIDINKISPFIFLQNLAQTSNALKLEGSCDFGSISDKDLIACLDLVSISFPKLKLITIPIADATTKSLAQAIYAASVWIDKLTEKGKRIEQISDSFRFEFNVGQHYFLELACIRAFKRLWLALLEAYQVPTPVMPFLHATTKSDQNENQYWNMITATTQAMTAAIAGVHSLHVKPCNGAADDAFTRRIARNVQHLLQEESYFNRVIDPAAGAYYIENLTAALVQKSWQQFCEL